MAGYIMHSIDTGIWLLAGGLALGAAGMIISGFVAADPQKRKQRLSDGMWMGIGAVVVTLAALS